MVGVHCVLVYIRLQICLYDLVACEWLAFVSNTWLAFANFAPEHIFAKGALESCDPVPQLGTGCIHKLLGKSVQVNGKDVPEDCDLSFPVNLGVHSAVGREGQSK